MGPNFPGMRRLILVLMLNVLLGCDFEIFGGYLVVTANYLVVTGGYCLLLLITACSHF